MEYEKIIIFVLCFWIFYLYVKKLIDFLRVYFGGNPGKSLFSKSKKVHSVKNHCGSCGEELDQFELRLNNLVCPYCGTISDEDKLNIKKRVTTNE